MTLNERIEQLEQQVETLLAKIADLSANVEEKNITPYTVSGGNKSSATNMPVDAKTGLGLVLANHVIWNDAESVTPPLNAEPTPPPTKGYNKHAHSRYSGGALIKDTLEIVEYDWNSVTPSISNKDSQQFWVTQPKIKTEVDTSNPLKPTVEKIGLLDLTFNPSTKKWGVAALEIDINKCYFVERDPTTGAITLDSKLQPRRSPLYNSDINKTSIVWDENGNCWRLYAVYAPGA